MHWLKWEEGSRKWEVGGEKIKIRLNEFGREKNSFSFSLLTSTFLLHLPPLPPFRDTLRARGVCSRIPHLPPVYRIYGLSSMYCLNEKTASFKTLILYHIKGFNPKNQNYKTCKGCAGFTPTGAQGFGKDCAPFIGVLMHNLLQTTSSIGNNHNNL